MNSKNTILRGVSCLAMIAPFAFATAQEAPAEASADQTRTFETVTVTAQKREQSLQDVPIVVTAIDGQLLSDAGVRDIKDLTVLTPGLLVTSTSNEAVTTARIRGIGTVGDNIGLESSVAVVIDGVVRARNGVGFGDLGEIERIEVLKGPQGTLFGRSTSAGVINIITKGPSDESEGGVALSLGNFGLVRTEGYVNLPISDALAARVYGVINSRDGYLDINTAGGPRRYEEDNDSDYYSVRGQVRYSPNEDFSLRMIADFTKREEFCCAAPVSVVGPTQPLVNAIAGGAGTATQSGTEYDRLAFSNRNTEQNIEDSGFSAEADWSLGIGDLTYIFSYRDWSLSAGQDTDFSGADIWWRNVDDNFTGVQTYSHEVRLANSTDRLDWLVGAYYSGEDIARTDYIRLGNDYYTYFANGLLSGLPAVLGVTQGNFLRPNDGLRDAYEQQGTSFAVFTNNTLRVTDQLELTLGLRYTEDEKDLQARYGNVGGSCSTAATNAGNLVNFLINVAGQAPATAQATATTIVGNLCLPWTNDFFNGFNTSQSYTDDDLSGTLKAAYRFNDQFMAYGSYSRGYKAGGFNIDRSSSGTGQADFSPGFRPVIDTSFPAETVESYELGVKTNSASGRLALNAAYFDQTYTDFQLNTFLGTSFIVTSIPEVTSKGVDADLRWSPEALEGLSLQGGVTYAITEYGSFTPVNPALSNLSGNTISFAPEWSTSIAATYDTAFFGGWNARYNLAARYTTEYNTGSDLDPRKVQDAFALVNGRITFYSENSPATLEIWGQNILDEDYRQVAFNTPLQSGSISDFLGAPATYGVTLRLAY